MTFVYKAPVSTTHTITGAIVGVGSTNKLRGIRWGLAGRIIWAWIFTIPAAFLVGFGLLKLAATKPETEGFANAILRDLGQQVVLSSNM